MGYILTMKQSVIGRMIVRDCTEGLSQLPYVMIICLNQI